MTEETEMDDKAITLLAEIAGDLVFAIGSVPNIYDEYEASKDGGHRIWESILVGDLERIKQYLDSIGYNKNDPQRDAENSAPHQRDARKS